MFLRGEQVSGEYDQGSVIDEEGWFPTKDRGWVDHEGYLFIEGRADDTIIRGGENIAPAEIEDVLARHPAVTDVVVVGVPDDEWGQKIAAVVVLAPGADLDAGALQAFAREHLRSSKTPEVVEFRSRAAADAHRQAPAPRGPRRPRGVTAAAGSWAASGLARLTGRPDGPPLEGPDTLLPRRRLVGGAAWPPRRSPTAAPTPSPPAGPRRCSCSVPPTVGCDGRGPSARGGRATCWRPPTGPWR